MARTDADDEREGVALTNLDAPLSDDAGVTKRDLVDYLDAVADRMLPGLVQRPLSVVRVRAGQPPFMQKNLPAHAPTWIASTTAWARRSHREVRYALCDDRRTLLWFANQRAVEYHVPLLRLADEHPRELVVDLDPPPGADFSVVVATAGAVRAVLEDAGLDSAVKTSGGKGVHVVVPLDGTQDADDVAAATRALAGRTADRVPDVATTAYVVAERGGRVFVDSTRSHGATLVAAYSPRARPGAPVSFPVPWPDLEQVRPTDFTVATAPGLLGDDDPWATLRPAPQSLPHGLVAQGRTIPVARVQAMHEGRRRRRAQDPGTS